jgi:alkylhydroperoxidase family enzyme
MPRLRQVPRSEVDDPVVLSMYDLVFGKGIDPLEAGTGTATGSEGDWWTVYALVPDVMEHAVQGFVLYRSPARKLDPVLRELSLTRAGWVCGSSFVYSQHCKALRGLGMTSEKIAAIDAWATSPLFDDAERAVLGFTDAMVYAHGRVPDALFEQLRSHLSDEAILELAYVAAMYGMHASIVRALRLESDDIDDPTREADHPDDFDAELYVSVGANTEAKAKLASVRAGGASDAPRQPG